MCFVVISILIGIIVTTDNGNQNSTDIDNTDGNYVEIKRNSDVMPMNGVEDVLNISDLVIEGSIIKKNETVFEPYVKDELVEEFKAEGYSEEHYSDIWTYYDVRVEKVIAGECEAEVIKYKIRGGIIGNVKQEMNMNITEGETYYFCLEEHGGAYRNILGAGAIHIDGDVLEGDLPGKFDDKFNKKSDFEEAFKNKKSKH